MAIKQELSENVYDKVLQHLSDTVKARLPKPQFSVVFPQLVGYHVYNPTLLINTKLTAVCVTFRSEDDE
jgi:hypothetical protein